VIVAITSYAFFLSFDTQNVPLNSAPAESLALVALAVSNNVGTGTSRSMEIPIISPKDVSVAQNAIVYDAMNREIFFVDIFRQLNEYEEVARIDIATYLKGKSNTKEALDFYIDELVQHTERAKKTLQSLNAQKLYHTNALQDVQTDIQNSQIKIEKAYTDRDSGSIMNAVADLDEFVLIQQDHKYGKIFGQQITKEYQSVLKFSENKLQAIQSNIPALVQ
jgi:hypothetical protein